MKSLNLFLIFLVILLIGCSSAPEQTTTKVMQEITESTEPTQQKQESSMPPPPPPGVVPAETTAKPIMSKELVALLSKVDKVKSYEFTYAPPPDNLARDRYSAKGNKIRIKKIYNPQMFVPAEYYDTVYLDTEKKTAIAFCESRDSKCTKGRQNYPLKYDSVIIQMPYELTKGITAGKLGQSETLFDRNVNRISYEKDGKEYTFWVDNRYALVVRMTISENGKIQRYDYMDLAVDNVKDEWVNPPQ